MKRKILFLSFGDNKYAPTLRRIKKEAESSHFFTDIQVLTEKDLGKEYQKQYKALFKLRGFGYWIWKSYITQRVLGELQDNDFLIYLDGGGSINPLAQKRFQEYLQFASMTESGIVVFQQKELLEKYWTKADLFDYTNTLTDSRITDTGQFCSGLFILRKCDASVRFVNQWADLCHNHFELITDAPSQIKNFDGFVEHRHDQSAFSVFAKQYNPYCIDSNETYTPHDFHTELKDYPLWLTRCRQYTWFYLKKHGIQERIKNIFKVFK